DGTAGDHSDTPAGCARLQDRIANLQRPAAGRAAIENATTAVGTERSVVAERAVRNLKGRVATRAVVKDSAAAAIGLAAGGIAADGAGGNLQHGGAGKVRIVVAAAAVGCRIPDDGTVLHGHRGDTVGLRVIV